MPFWEIEEDDEEGEGLPLLEDSSDEEGPVAPPPMPTVARLLKMEKLGKRRPLCPGGKFWELWRKVLQYQEGSEKDQIQQCRGR